MDDTPRAFSKRVKTNQVLLDDSALSAIKDIAHSIFMDEPRVSQHELMFRALHAYLLRKGAKPNFKVVLGNGRK